MKRLLSILSNVLPLTVSAWSPKLQKRQQHLCPTQVVVKSELATVVSGQILVVSTTVAKNTIISPGPFGTAITISDAPTVFSTTGTAYITITYTILHTYSRDAIINSPSAPATAETIASSSLTLLPQALTTVTSLLPSAPVTSPTNPIAGLPIDPVTGFARDPASGLFYDPATGLQLATNTTNGFPLDPTSGLPIDTTNGFPLDPTTGFPRDPATGLFYGLNSPNALPRDPATGFPIDPVSEVPIDPTTGRPVDANTRVPIDPVNGFPIDPFTDFPRDPATGTFYRRNSIIPLELDPVTGFPIDPETGLAINPTTGQPVNGMQAVPTSLVVLSPSGPSPTGANPITTSAIGITPGQTSGLLISGPGQYVTITSLYAGATPATSTLATPTAAGETGTVVVNLPQAFTTITSLYAGATPVTSTIATPTAAGETGTVVVQLPDPNLSLSTVTFFSGYPGSVTSSTTLITAISGSNVVAVYVQVPTSSTLLTSTTPAPSPLATDVCGIQGVSAGGTCLTTLPLACQALSSSSLLGTVFNQADVLACQTALGVFGTVNALSCFTSSLISSLTGTDLLGCIQSHVPMCSSCLPALPDVCTNFGSDISVLDITALTVCQSALGVFGTGVGAVCFTISSALSSLTGQNVAACLQQNIPICASSSGPTPTSLLGPTTVTGCGGTPTATSCVTALPAECEVQSSGLLGNILGSVDTLACQTALGVFGTVNAAVCFTSNLLSTFTGRDFTSCLTNHLPMCGNCLSALPSACQPSSGELGSVCQLALGHYGTTAATSCFLTGVFSSVVTTDLVSCLNGVLPYCSSNVLSTTTQTIGLTPFTSTVTSTIGGLLGVGATTTTYVLVGVPSPYSTSYLTRGSTSFTTTTTSFTTIAGGLLQPATTRPVSTYVVVVVPTGTV